ncbi:MAG: S24 family peptidase [Nitratireductor sp.]
MGRPPKVASGVGARIASLYLDGEKRREFAARIGFPDSTLANYVRGDREPSASFLKLLDAAGYDANWVLTGRPSSPAGFSEEQAGFGPLPPGAVPLGPPADGSGSQVPVPQVPVYGTAAGSASGAMAVSQDHDAWVARPPGLQHSANAYALTVIGSSMEPRYFPGDLIFVDPARPVFPGDFIVIQTGDGSGFDAWLKQLVRFEEAGLVAAQLVDGGLRTFSRDEVRAVHKVLSTAELMGLPPPRRR